MAMITLLPLTKRTSTFWVSASSLTAADRLAGESSAGMAAMKTIMKRTAKREEAFMARTSGGRRIGPYAIIAVTRLPLPPGNGTLDSCELEGYEISTWMFPLDVSTWTAAT